jgi:hypothetical protein
MRSALARRWWVLAACALGAAVTVFALASARPAPYVATATVGVPVVAPADIGDRAAQAQAVAALLRADPAVASAAGGDLRVIAVEDETTLSLVVRAPDAPRAVAGAHAAARRVTSGGARGVPAGTLVAVDVPDRATLDGTGRPEAALVAAVLGLVAGAIAVGWRERTLTAADRAGASNLRAW